MAKNRGTGCINEIFMTQMCIQNIGQIVFKISSLLWNLPLTWDLQYLPLSSKDKDYIVLQKNDYVQAYTYYYRYRLVHISIIFHSVFQTHYQKLYCMCLSFPIGRRLS